MEKVSEVKRDGSSFPSTGFGELFRFVDGLDYVLMAIGTVGAIVHGSSLPLFLRFFADLVNSFGSNANNIDKMTHEVIKYAFYFLVVGAAIWTSSWQRFRVGCGLEREHSIEGEKGGEVDSHENVHTEMHPALSRYSRFDFSFPEATKPVNGLEGT